MVDLSHFKALYLEGIEGVGVTRDIKMRVLAVFSDASEQWHYFGVPDDGVGATEHEAIHFPADIVNLPDASGILYDLGVECLFRRLATAV